MLVLVRSALTSRNCEVRAWYRVRIYMIPYSKWNQMHSHTDTLCVCCAILQIIEYTKHPQAQVQDITMHPLKRIRLPAL